jgi:hypothetical protein
MRITLSPHMSVMLPPLILYSAVAAAAVVLVIAIRTIRWRRIAAKNPLVVWAVGSGNSVSIGVAEILWYNALLAPGRLAATVSDLTQGWARQRVARALQHRMQDSVRWLRAHMSHPDVLPGHADLTHIEIGAGLQDSLSVMGSAGDDLRDHLVDWMHRIPSQPDVIDTDLVGLDSAPDWADAASGAIDVVGSIGAIGIVALARHGYKVHKGDKTVGEAFQDGSTEIVAKGVGGVAGLTAVTMMMDTVTFGAATVSVVAGRLIGGAVVKGWRRRELRSLKKTLRGSVADVGAELYIGDRCNRLRNAIWAPWRRNRDALAVLSREIRRARRRITYWIWPSPRHVLYVLAKRRGRLSEKASRHQAELMIQNLERINQSENRDVLAGKLLIRSPRLQAELVVPAHLVRQAKSNHDDILAEADRLHRRYGY